MENNAELEYLQATNSIDIIVGDFNYDLLKVSEKKLLGIFTDNVHIVNKLTHISGLLIDHVYIKKTVVAEFSINATVKTFTFQIMTPYKL